MRGRGGMAWLAAAFWLAGLMSPAVAKAADVDAWGIPPGWRLPIIRAAAQTPMEAQMSGEKPFQAQPSLRPERLTLPGTVPGLALDGEGGATLRLPHHLEMRISFLYNRDSSSWDSQKRGDSSLLMKYSMDYRLLPNLQVGLNGYLYRPDAGEGFAFQRPFGDRVMGLGPGLKYDLGSWSFVLKSQLETGGPKGEDLQNWFRVWYAF